jgi:hypothetical protein
MYRMDWNKGNELNAKLAADPIDRDAIWDAFILSKPIPEGITRERLALEIVSLMSGMSAADTAGSMQHERYAW